MNNPLWSDIRAQGENTVRVLGHLLGGERKNLDAAAGFCRPDRPFAFFGVASAQYLCKPAVHFLNRAGQYAADWCASQGADALIPALREANVVINSRSGETAEVVRLAQSLSEARIPYIAITNEPDSTAARLAVRVIWTNTRKDELVSINVVTGMMLSTLAFAAAVTGELDTLRPEFERVAGAMGETVDRAALMGPAMRDLFEGVHPLYLLYRGASAGSAFCGRLVLEEVARRPGVAMGAAEFRQGPNEVIDDRFGAVVLVPQGKDGELNRKLAADIRRSGGRVLAVGQLPGPELSEPGALSFALPAVHESLSPVLEVVPALVLAYELAKAQGYEPGQVRYITKVILSEEGIPNEGRPGEKPAG